MQAKTLQKVVEKLVDTPSKTEIKDFSICGKCSKCGECCSNFLPVCQSEIDRIQEYVITNKIRPQAQMLVMENKLTCPYYDGKKCLIYEARPLICKEFYCYKKPSSEMAKKFSKEEYITVNMWALAKKMDKYFK